MLLQQFEILEIFCLEGLRYVIFALHHRTEEPGLHHRPVGLLEDDVVTHEDVGHSVNTGDMFVQQVQTVTQFVTDVTLDVGCEHSDIMLSETDAGDVFG